MPNLTVPEEHIDGLRYILGLSAEDSKRISVALESATTTGLRDLTELIAIAIPDIEIRKAREIVTVLRSLYIARNALEITVDTFVDEILKAASQVGIVSSASDALGDSLRSLLSIRPLSLLSKARGLHIEHENVFCSARIMSDLRPVFDVNIEEEPTGLVMAHILKLSYHNSGEHRELYVAIDKLDIQNLIDSLERAKAKAKTLRKMVNSKNLTIMAD